MDDPTTSVKFPAASETIKNICIHVHVLCLIKTVRNGDDNDTCVGGVVSNDDIK